MKLEHSTLRTVYSAVDLTQLHLLSFQHLPVTCNYCDYYSDWEIVTSNFYVFWKFH